MTQVICCTCLEQPAPDVAYFTLDSNVDVSNELSLKEKLLYCIPEFEDILEGYGGNPWICKFCCEALCWSYNFRKMCLEIKNKLEKSTNDVRVHIKEEAIDIHEMTVSLNSDHAVIKTEALSDESSKNNSLVEIESRKSSDFVLIERACNTISFLKEKNVTPKRLLCFVKLDLLPENQLKPPTKRKKRKSKKKSTKKAKKQKLQDIISRKNVPEESSATENTKSLPLPEETEENANSDLDNCELNLRLSETDEDCIHFSENSQDDIRQSWKHRMRHRSEKVQQKELSEELEEEENEKQIKKRRKTRGKSWFSKKKFELKEKTIQKNMKNGEEETKTVKNEEDIGTCKFYFNLIDKLRKHETVFVTVTCPTCENSFNEEYYQKTHKHICGRSIKDFEEIKRESYQCGICNERFDGLDALNLHCIADKH